MRSIFAYLMAAGLLALVPAAAWCQPPVPRELPPIPVPAPPAETKPIPGDPKQPAESPLYSSEINELLGNVENTWISAAPYAWVFSYSGNIGVHGAHWHIDQAFPDKLDELKDGAAAPGLHVEGGMGNLGVLVDGMVLRDTAERGFVNVRSDIAMVEVLGFYRVFCATPKQTHFTNLTVDLLAGVRYYDVSNELSIPFALPGGAGQSDSWFDCVVGVRGSVQIHDGLVAFARADCGGFSLNDSSKRAVNLLGGVEYACPFLAGSSFVAAYRIFEVDRRSGTGLNSFVYDVKMSGPFLAFKVSY